VVRVEERETDQVGYLARIPDVSRWSNVKDHHVPEVNAERESSDGREEGRNVKLATQTIANSEEVLQIKTGECGKGKTRPDAAGVNDGSHGQAREFGDDGTVDEPEVVVAEIRGVQIEVVRIGRRDPGAKYAVSPVRSRSDVVKREAQIEALAALEVYERKCFECDKTKREHQDARAYRMKADKPSLPCATEVKILGDEHCDEPSETEQHEDGCSGKRKEAANQHRSDSGNSYGKRNTPE